MSGFITRNAGTDPAKRTNVGILASASLDLNDDSPQIMYQVTDGKRAIITGIVLRDPSGNVSGNGGNITFGWEADGLGLISEDSDYYFKSAVIARLAETTWVGRGLLYPRNATSTSATADGSMNTISTVGGTLYGIVTNPDTNHTLVVDIIGYEI